MATTPVFLPGEFHGQKSLAGYSPWGRKESDTTEMTEHTHQTLDPAPPHCTVGPEAPLTFLGLCFCVCKMGMVISLPLKVTVKIREDLWRTIRPATWEIWSALVLILEQLPFLQNEPKKKKKERNGLVFFSANIWQTLELSWTVGGMRFPKSFISFSFSLRYCQFFSDCYSQGFISFQESDKTWAYVVTVWCCFQKYHFQNKEIRTVSVLNVCPQLINMGM